MPKEPILGRNGNAPNPAVAQLLTEGCGGMRLSLSTCWAPLTSKEEEAGCLWGSQDLRALLATPGEKLAVHSWLGWTVDTPLLGITLAGSWKPLGILAMKSISLESERIRLWPAEPPLACSL